MLLVSYNNIHANSATTKTTNLAEFGEDLCEQPPVRWVVVGFVTAELL
jgi:hypothetical protein